MVKNIVTTLDQKKLLDETFIIFTSDNGFHLGKIIRASSGTSTDEIFIIISTFQYNSLMIY